MPRARHDEDEDQDEDAHDDYQEPIPEVGPPPLALRPKQAAAAMGLSLSTLERARKAGYIRAGKFGRAVVYRWEDLATALEDAVRRGDLDATYNRTDDELSREEYLRLLERDGGGVLHAMQLRGKKEPNPRRSETTRVMRQRVRDSKR